MKDYKNPKLIEELETIRKEMLEREEFISPSQVNLVPLNGYFLGYKLLKYNELWKWDTLEDVKV